MAHTNTTANYELPQFIGSDKPAWLVDFNQAMTAIDTAMKANQTAAGNAANAAAQAQTGADTANGAATAAGATAQSALLTANQTAADLLSLQNTVSTIPVVQDNYTFETIRRFNESGTQFTPDKSGFMVLDAIPASSATGVLTVTVPSENVVVSRQVCSGGARNVAIIPVFKGKTYSLNVTALNLSTSGYVFIKPTTYGTM